MSIFILEKVCKSYKVDKKEISVLKNIDLIFPDHGLISIVGKSGSGKSTLLNLLMGIEKPTSGKINFKGKNIAQFNDRKYSSFHLNEVSLVFQHYNLFDNLSVFENIVLPARMAGKRKRKYKSKARDLLKDLHIEKLLKRKAKNLSGGEKQRVAIARALINEPSVILCDEPTGALDYKNSREIMWILKENSKKLLIILVSHNMELVNEFSDYVVHIKDGKIENKLPLKIDNVNPKVKIKRKYRGNWISTFICKNFKNDFIKNVFSFLACTIGFTAMFLCTGFVFGSTSSQDEALKKNLSIGCATVSCIENVEMTDSPLTYEKTVRPSLKQLDEITSNFTTLDFEENLSYFISCSASCSYNGITKNEFEVLPVLDLTLSTFGCDMLISGRGGNNNFDEILVNEEFAKLFDLKVNDEIIYRNNSSSTFNTYDKDNPFIKDDLIIEKPMKIVGILREFPFLNNPKIYYSYPGAKRYLKNQMMENLSFFKGRFISFYEYLESAENDNEITSYSSLIFLKKLEDLDKFFELIDSSKNTNIEITSSALEIKNTYNMFISSFSKTLLVFVIIAFIGINLILGMISLSTYIDNRKNTAILTCLGSKNSSIYKIYLIENYLLIGFSYFISIYLSLIFESILNPIISKKFALSNLIMIPFETLFNVKYGLIFLLCIIAVIFSTLFSVIPMFIYRRNFISEELRDE